jgi:hypothetical protein
MSKIALFVLVFSLMLTGCATDKRPPYARGKRAYPARVYYDYDHYHYYDDDDDDDHHHRHRSHHRSHRGSFCPPGQAKKGRC